MPANIPRQAFIRGALGAAARVLVGSCRATVAAAPEWSALGDSIEGQVIVPSSAGYAAAKNPFNSRFDGSTPAAVVTAASTDDVRKAVVFAAHYGVTVTSRSGGHSCVGASAADGAMVIDVRGLPGGIAYDDASGLVTISAGADLDSVQTPLAAHGRLIPSGSCPTVGVAGVTLGGGLGSDARQGGI